METKKILATDESPEVILDKENNKFNFSGKSLPEDVKEFYEPILNWIEEYAKDPNESTVVKFKMDYFNSASSKQILEVLDRFSKIKETGKDISVKWYFLEEDEDMEDAGEAYKDIVKIPFEMIGYY